MTTRKFWQKHEMHNEAVEIEADFGQWVAIGNLQELTFWANEPIQTKPHHTGLGSTIQVPYSTIEAHEYVISTPQFHQRPPALTEAIQRLSVNEIVEMRIEGQMIRGIVETCEYTGARIQLKLVVRLLANDEGRPLAHHIANIGAVSRAIRTNVVVRNRFAQHTGVAEASGARDFKFEGYTFDIPLAKQLLREAYGRQEQS